MPKTLVWIAVALLTACSAAPTSAPKALPRVAPTEMGPFGVARHIQSMTVPKVPAAGPLPIPDRQAELTIWYPTNRDLWLRSGGRGRTLFNHASGMSIADLPPVKGYKPFPLIIFSHGLAGTRDQNPYQMDWLASRGYVIVSVDHHPSTLLDIIAAGGETDGALTSALRRPYEVLAEIDEAEKWNADPLHPLYGKIDSRRVLVIGHSFGGYSAIAVSGARGGIKQFIGACDNNVTLDDTFQCRIAREYKGNAIETRIVDPRIVAVMPMAPGATYAFAGGFDEVVVPVFMWGAQEDDVVPPRLFLDWMYDELPAPKIYAWIPGAGHNDFSQLCLGGLPINCGSHEPMSAKQILTMINVMTAAFADWTVRQDPNARTWLDADYVRSHWPIRYQIAW